MTCVSRCQPRLDKEALGAACIAADNCLANRCEVKLGCDQPYCNCTQMLFVDILFVAFSVFFYFWTPKIMVAAHWGDLTVHSWRPSECKLRKLFLLHFSIPYRITYHFTDVAQFFWLTLQSKAHVIRRHGS